MKTRITSLLIAAGVICAALPARATVTESIPGSICQNIYPPNATGLGDWVYHATDQTWNGSYQAGGNNAARYVMCPLHRDLALSSSAIPNLYVAANDSTGTMFCAAGTYDEFGNNIMGQSVTIAGAGSMDIYFGGLTATTAWGFLEVGCTLPPAAGISSIQYQEQ